MTPVYYEDFECGELERRISHGSCKHLHASSDGGAAALFVSYMTFHQPRRTEALHALGGRGMGSLVGPRTGDRYVCITGPRGWVRGVIYDDAS